MSVVGTANSATLSNLIISKSNYGLSLILPSTKFIQCQTIFWNGLKSSPNSDIKALWQDSNTFTNIQYDQYSNAKQLLTSIQTHHHHRITSELTSQGLVTSLTLNTLQRLPPAFGQTFNKNCPKIFSTFL